MFRVLQYPQERSHNCIIISSVNWWRSYRSPSLRCCERRRLSAALLTDVRAERSPARTCLVTHFFVILEHDADG
jgi:hypothetical protein